MDSTTITSKHPDTKWAKHNSATNGIKVHVVFDGIAQVPISATITNGNVADITVAKTLNFTPGSFLINDRAYFCTKQFVKLNNSGVKFITRLKKLIDYNVMKETYALKK